MMKNIITLLLLCCGLQFALAQEKCTSETSHLVDVNVVDKCLVEKKVEKNTETTPAVVTTISSRRHFRKRVYFEKVISLANDIEANKIKLIKTTSDLAACRLYNIFPITRKITKKATSFDVVDEIPVFLSCTDPLMDKVDCFNYEMQNHIINTLKYPEEALDKGIEGEVLVSFVIDETGKVTDIKTEGANAHEILKKEAKRIVLLLPDFKPGKQQGKNTRVAYSFPMNFSLNSSEN
ncbi:MAG: energy transducer TonB [Tenacibaculum sp.]|uniref:energy transducer TonB n=1 Tax=Tenacibaculum sp. TaxID=1906242 RepID=UPI001828A921|nr:energy transducer TonB [Tenacibaculum sp.]NVK08416.1 energy transducer TonB [Tenacibaculum sp.]